MIKRTGVSPLISTVILIALVISISAFVSPWIFNLVRNASNQTQTITDTEIKCNNAAYDFDSAYGTHGVRWSFSTRNNTLGVRIMNTGMISLHNFSFELIFNQTKVEYYHAKASTQRTASNPLKPGQTAFINASFTRDVNNTLTAVKVLNIVCPNVYASQST